MRKMILLVGVSATSLSLAIPHMAYAQDTGASQPAESSDAEKSSDTAAKKPKKVATENKEGDIVVVGSRIRRGVKNLSQNVQIIRPEGEERAGRFNTRETLQSTRVTGGGDQITSIMNGVLVDGGPGVATLSLRRLGPGRTLILLNGRRMSPAGVGGSVSSTDLNTIPSALTEQIQILKDGASSVYGSDAMGGVVDIITRKRIQGLESRATFTVGQEEGGEELNISTVGGFSKDRFNFTFGVDFNFERELEWGDRKRFTCPTNYRIDPNALNPVPGSGDEIDPTTGKPRCWSTDSGGFSQNIMFTGLIRGTAYDGTPQYFWSWKPNDTIASGIPGFEGISAPLSQTVTNKTRWRRDFFNPGMLKSSVNGEKRLINGMVSMTYDLQALGDAEVYVDVLAGHRTYFYDFNQQESVEYVKGSPLIPTFFSTASGLDPADILSKGKEVAVTVLTYGGTKRDHTELDYLRTSGGIRGDLFLPGWRYDMTITSSTSDAKETTPVRLTSHIRESMDVVLDPNTNTYVCANAEARANGCVPIPVFSAAVFQKDGLPKAWLNYIYYNMVTRTKYTETAFNGDFDGPLIDLPYGQLKGALGYEVRFSEINDTPDKESIADNTYNRATSAITRGKGRSYEFYGEMEAPLLTEVPFVKSLVVNASARYTKDKDYDYNTTFKVGGAYTPFSWVSFRVNYGTSYRAPALFERYLGDTTGFVNANGTDPCTRWDTDLTPGSVLYNNCKAEGLPEGFRAGGFVTSIRRGGKSTGLKSETSKNFAAGISIMPELPTTVGTFVFTADFYDIKLNGGIARLSAAGALGQCYNDPDFRAKGKWCKLIGERDPNTKQLTTIASEYLNLSTIGVRGMSFNGKFTRDIGLGTFMVDADLSYTMRNRYKLFATDSYRDSVGEMGNPRFSGEMDMAYSWKRWTWGYNLSWIDATNNYKAWATSPANIETLKTMVYWTDDYFKHTLSMGYQGDTWSASLIAGNITNAMPPRVSSGGGSRLGDMLYYGGYDTYGRSFILSLRKKY